MAPALEVSEASKYDMNGITIKTTKFGFFLFLIV
jgi:hypothetical protein